METIKKSSQYKIAKMARKEAATNVWLNKETLDRVSTLGETNAIYKETSLTTF